jgi:hypothetical protein
MNQRTKRRSTYQTSRLRVYKSKDGKFGIDGVINKARIRKQYSILEEAVTKPLPRGYEGDAKGKEKGMEWEKVWEKEGEKATEREELQFRKALRDTDFAPETPEPRTKPGYIGIEDIRAISRSAREALEEAESPF